MTREAGEGKRPAQPLIRLAYTRHLLPAMRGEGKNSKRLQAIHVQHHAIKRVGGRDVEVIPLRSTEADVGANLRDLHLADQRAADVEAMHTVVGRSPEAAI